jgi:hypothetical protein
MVAADSSTTGAHATTSTDAPAASAAAAAADNAEKPTMMGNAPSKGAAAWTELKDDRGAVSRSTQDTLELQERAGTTDPAAAIEGGAEYKVYKRRWFGLLQLALLNIIVSWDVSTLPCISGQRLERPRCHEGTRA